MAESKLKMESAKSKSLERQFKKVEKALRESWYKNRDSIKFIKTYKTNKEALKEVYGKEERNAIKECIKQLQETGELRLENPKALYKALKQALKSKNAHDYKYNFVEMMEKEEKEKEAKESKAKKKGKKETQQAKEEENKENEANDSKNHFKDDLDMKCFTKHNINVNTMESALDNLNLKLTPKEFLYYIATLNFENDNFTNTEEAKNAAKKLRSQIINKEIDEKDMTDELTIEKGAQIFKKAREGTELVRAGAGDRIAYKVAQEYEDIKDMENVNEQPDLQQETDSRTD